MRAAGAIILGKTNTPEYGHKGLTDNPLFGESRNPWSLTHTPGGSSGGSAAALAGGIVPLATGTDGGGSIRIPATVCGLSGIKTEQGRIPITGPTMPGSGLLSTNGPMANRIEDSAWALDVVIGHHPLDPLSLPHPGTSWYEATRAGATALSPLGWCGARRWAMRRWTERSRQPVELRSTRWPLRAPRSSRSTASSTLTRSMPGSPCGWCARFKAQGHLIGTADWGRLSPSIQPQILAGENVSGRRLRPGARRHLRAECAARHRLRTCAADPLPHCSRPGAPAWSRTAPSTARHPSAGSQFTYGINMTRNPAATTPVGLSSAGIPARPAGHRASPCGSRGHGRGRRHRAGHRVRPARPVVTGPDVPVSL